MNQEFLDYCKINYDKPLPLLLDHFKRKYPDFDINEFVSWKTSSNHSELISEFYNYPFLRDQLFLSFIKTLKPDYLDNFENFILKTQSEYFKKFINPEFNEQVLSNPSKISKCPFAPKACNAFIRPFAFEPISRIRYSFIENTHISDMKIDNLTVNIVKPESERAKDAKFNVLLSGIHLNLDFNNESLYIMMSDTRISHIVPLTTDHRLAYDAINEILKFKTVLTAADALFLFPENVLVINSVDLDRLLNIIIYLNIFKLPLNLKSLKSIGLTSKSLTPSFLEPYADILTTEYIKNNFDLFQ